MFSNNLNLNQLRIFESVYRLKSMTEAAHELHLTQSGVSQHMKSLEGGLGVRLFDRVKQRLVPTSAALKLYEHCTLSLGSLDQALTEIRGGSRDLSGTVAIGTPIEFGNNILMPRIAAFCRKHPRVKFQLRYGFATEMNEGLLSGALDFAYVDAFSPEKRIHLKKVYDEVLELCAAPELIKRLGMPPKAPGEQRAYFERLEYVDYQAGEPVLRLWLEHHLKSKKLNLNLRAAVMDVQGVARLILSGLAAGVLPGYLVSKLESEGKKLYIFRGCGKPLKNTISLGRLDGRSHSPAAAAALEAFSKGI